MKIMSARMVIGQDMQRDSPRATIVDVGGLELSVRARLVGTGARSLLHLVDLNFMIGRIMWYLGPILTPVDHGSAGIARLFFKLPDELWLKGGAFVTVAIGAQWNP
ncbi:hypothetical protein [Nocardia alba]|uniref:hypothetical protein n=1 Tax=Nocardia alba TaxID=225051 RepID=UPI0010486AA0|nr:hypothetical protein [Nocardia alba]